MPKFTFECQSCNVRFTRSLRLGEHPNHQCPSCQKPAPRYWEGQGFAFEFAEGGEAPGNSGVTKHDYPTADNAVGRSADKRWAEYRARDKVKKKVREVGGTHALHRENAPDRSYVEYAPLGENGLEKRREAVKTLREREPR